MTKEERRDKVKKIEAYIKSNGLTEGAINDINSLFPMNKETIETESAKNQPAKKKRGRPPKSAVVEAAEVVVENDLSQEETD